VYFIMNLPLNPTSFSCGSQKRKPKVGEDKSPVQGEGLAVHSLII
jgi:hypothetical protein